MNNRLISQTSLDGVRFRRELTLQASGFLHQLVFHFENPGSKSVEIKDWEWGWGPGLGTVETERKENPRMTRALQMGKLKAHALKPGEYPEESEWDAIDNRYFMASTELNLLNTLLFVKSNSQLGEHSSGWGTYEQA